MNARNVQELLPVSYCVMKMLLKEVDPCKVQRKTFWSARFLQLAFTHKGIKGTMSSEGKLPLTDIEALGPNVFMKCIASNLL